MVPGVRATDCHTMQKFCISKETKLSVCVSDPISEDWIGRSAKI